MKVINETDHLLKEEGQGTLIMKMKTLMIEVEEDP